MSVVEDHVALPIGGEPERDEIPSPGGQAEPDSRVIARLADEMIPALVDRMSSSSLGELEVRQDGWRVRLRRAPSDGASSPAPAQTGHTKSERPGHAPPEPHRSPARPRPPNGGSIASPAVGYYQPRDGLSKGSTVRGGDLLGHVDVLGVLHDVAVPEDGRLVELLAEAGQAVEYGQPLARLEPESRA